MDLDPEQGQQREIYRLVRENNQMLHKMRRHAFWGGILRFIFLTAILLAPIWFYMTYLNATVEKMLHTIDQIQGTGGKAQVQMGGLEQIWKDFESKFSGFGGSGTTSPK